MTVWWKNKVIYQIYPRSFNDSNGDGVGDIKGIISKIPYLSELGIEILWLSPVYKSPDADNGYDISDYYSIDDKFGSMEDFEELVTVANKHSIKIMMDIVVNHTSDEHPWFIESSSSTKNEYRDYYIWKKPKANGDSPNNWGSSFGGSAWEFDENTGEYYLHIFGKKQPDLNWENPKLRTDIYEMMNFWLEKGVAGFRLDVINMISKDQSFPDGELRPNGWGKGSPYYYNGPKIHDYLNEMHNTVFKDRELITVGEMPRLSIEDAQLYTDPHRNELDMVFHFEHTRLGEGKFGKWSPEKWKLTELKNIFSEWQYGLENEGWNSLYWSNHDQPRAISRFGDDDKKYRTLSGKMLATCLHMHKGTPYIYQGEEIGMVNPRFDSLSEYRDIEIHQNYKQLVSEGYLTHEEMMKGIQERSRDTARTPMQWSNDKNAGFTKGIPWIPLNPNYEFINANAALNDKNSLFYFYKKLIELRKTMPIIVDGTYQLIFPQDEQIYAFTRKLNEKELIVICNFTNETVKRDFSKYKLDNSSILINNYNTETEINNNCDSELEILPYQAVVYYKKCES